MEKIYCIYILSMTPNIRVETIKESLKNNIGNVEAVYFTYDKKYHHSKGAFVYFTVNYDNENNTRNLQLLSQGNVIILYPYPENKYIFWKILCPIEIPIPCEIFSPLFLMK
jgi:hypothetical protein